MKFENDYNMNGLKDSKRMKPTQKKFLQPASKD